MALASEERVAAMHIKLTCHTGSMAGQVFDLDSEDISIGRHPNNQIWLNPFEELGVSRHHCHIFEREGVVCIVDKGSRSGTLVEGALIRGPTPLHEGSVFRLGPEGPEFQVSFPARMQKPIEESKCPPTREKHGWSGPWICPTCLRPSKAGGICAQDQSALAPQFLITARPGVLYSFFTQGLIQDAVLEQDAGQPPEKRRLAVSYGGGVVLFSEEVAAQPPPASSPPLVAIARAGPGTAAPGASPSYRRELWCAVALPPPQGLDMDYAQQHPGLLRTCGCQALSFVPSEPALLACLSLRPAWDRIHTHPFTEPSRDAKPAETALKSEPVAGRLLWTLSILDLWGNPAAETSWPFEALSQAATFGEAWVAPRPALACAADGRLVRVGPDLVVEAPALTTAAHVPEGATFTKFTPACVQAAAYASMRWCWG